MNFSENLMQLRKEKSLSQEELGYILGVTRQTVSKWEMGQTTPEMDKLIELATFFDVSIDYLVGKSSDNDSVPKERDIPLVFYPRALNYEYRSKRTFLGLPLIHINIGFGFKRAKGIIAIGNVATGIVSIGAISLGGISVGALSLGLLSIGALSIGVAALGGLALGLLALGGIAVGHVAMGGLTIGTYCLGGYASASRIARGGYAKGNIAIGDAAFGEYTWQKIQDLTKEDFLSIRSRIISVYPNIPEWLLNLFSKQ